MYQQLGVNKHRDRSHIKVKLCRPLKKNQNGTVQLLASGLSFINIILMHT